jgi:hypothetical protein
MTALREMIEEMVDEIFDIEGPVRIGNLTFYRSAIVREMDPVAYREAVADMIDYQVAGLRHELERMDPEVDAEEIEDFQARIEELEDCL